MEGTMHGSEFISERLLPQKRLIEIDRTVCSIGGKRNERKTKKKLRRLA
jgi:hypothetical protein